MDSKVKLRLNWIELYKELGHAGKNIMVLRDLPYVNGTNVIKS